MDNTERFLPVGSVVLLKGGTKKTMVTGFCSVDADDKTKIYDYTGCIYPEGYLDFEQICLFDHSQIEKVFHVGYIDDEEKEFKQDLQEIIDNIDSGKETISSYISETDFDSVDVEEEVDGAISEINKIADETDFSDNEQENQKEELEYL